MSDNKHSIDDQTTTKSLFDEYLDIFTFKTRPVTDEWIEQLAKDLVKWSTEDDEAFKLTQYYRSRGIGSDDMKRWCERSPKLKKAHTVALQALGDRREIGALKKKYDPGMTRTMMPRYDKDWKKIEEWRSTLRAKETAAGGGTKFVIMNDFPNSDKVPVKEEKIDK